MSILYQVIKVWKISIRVSLDKSRTIRRGMDSKRNKTLVTSQN